MKRSLKSKFKTIRNIPRLEYIKQFFTHEDLEKMTEEYLARGKKITIVPPDPRLKLIK